MTIEVEVVTEYNHNGFYGTGVNTWRAELKCGCNGYEFDCLQGFGQTQDEAIADLKRQVDAGRYAR